MRFLNTFCWLTMITKTVKSFVSPNGCWAIWKFVVFLFSIITISLTIIPNSFFTSFCSCCSTLKTFFKKSAPTELMLLFISRTLHLVLFCKVVHIGSSRKGVASNVAVFYNVSNRAKALHIFFFFLCWFLLYRFILNFSFGCQASFLIRKLYTSWIFKVAIIFFIFILPTETLKQISSDPFKF